MNFRLFLLRVVYVLLSLIQSAVLEDASQVCPSLSGESVRVLCQTANGPIACTDAQVGIKARAFWRKTVITGNQPVGDTTLVCQPPGVWVMEKLSDKTNNNTGQQYRGNGGVSAVPRRLARAATAHGTVTAANAFVSIAGFGLYKYFKFLGNLNEANETCRNENSKLLIIDSIAEMNAVFIKLLQPNLKDFDKAGLFLGVRMNDNKMFFTDFDEPFPGTSGLRWGQNEPSKLSNKGCVFIDVPGFTAHNMPCNGHVANFVCERP